jgi:plasmid rolling circle replication initiator protein Rep
LLSFFSIKHIFVLIVSDLQYFENSITNLPTDDEKASNKGKADMKKSNKIMVILFSTCTQQLQSQLGVQYRG